MNCSFIQLLEDRFKQQLWDAVSIAIDEDNTRYLPVRIKTVNIKYINTSVLLQCEDYAEFPTILNVETSCTEDGCTYRRAMDILKMCRTPMFLSMNCSLKPKHCRPF